MSSKKFSPGPAKKRKKVESSCEIDKLSDADLSEIFKRLPPYERLLVSEVSSRWRGVNRAVWTDVTDLDLSPIPGPNIAAIIKRCPNLRNVIAVGKTFGVRQLHILSRVELASVKFFSCEFLIPTTIQSQRTIDALAAIFADSIRTAAWEELMLLPLSVKPSPAYGSPYHVRVALKPAFPASLKRLQIRYTRWHNCLLEHSQHPDDVERLKQNLEGLMLYNTFGQLGMSLQETFCGMEGIASLKNLKELYLKGLYASDGWEKACTSLPKLETLFMNSFNVSPSDLSVLVAKHPSLRILILTGECDEMEFPTRVRYGNGFNAAPLPQLHIFVGRWPSENIRFPKYPNDAAKVYPISEPLPQFLNREDIKPIFEGVWIADKIRVTERDVILFYCERDVATCLLSI